MRDAASTVSASFPWQLASAVAIAIVIALVGLLIIARRRESEYQNREMRMIAKLSSVISAGWHDVDELLEVCTQVLIDVGVAHAVVVHLSDVEHRLALRSVAGLDEGVTERIDREEVLSDLRGSIARSTRPGDSLPLGSSFQKALDGRSLQHLGTIPLTGRTRPLGVMTVFANRAPVPRDLHMLMSAGSLISVGVENTEMARRADESQNELKQLAITDDLTGLYNRRFLDEYLRIQFAMSRRQKTPIAFLLLDIDYFKHINDSFGHETGDRVLTKVGEMIRTAVRGSDLAVRYGGEEFLIVMPDTDRSGAVAFATRVIGDFATASFSEFSVGSDDREIRLTVSVGIAIHPMAGESVRELLRACDEALYAAKDAGRNCVCVHPSAGPPDEPAGA